MKNCTNGHSISGRELILIMKCSLFFLLIALHVSAANFGQNRINLTEKNVSLTDVFQKIEKQTTYRFYYSNDVLPEYKLISINFINASIQDVLPKLLDGTNIVWDVTPKNKVILAENDIRNSQFPALGRIAGLVVDDKGEPIQGASVIVVGQSRGVSTNINGEFVIDAGTESILEISAIGYKVKRIAVKDIPQGVFRIELEQDLQNLDQVVVVGYGKVQRKNLTSSIVSVKASDVVKSTETSLNSALQGRAAGVSVVSSEGGPFSNVNITIRAGSSISGKNEPLYVINGFPQVGGGSNLNINVNDIESVDILKDAAAAAYGSRGANGVVLITTKSGKAGKVSISYDGYVTSQIISNTVKVMNAGQYAEIQHYLNREGQYGDTTMFRNWQTFNDSASINWLDRILRNPMGQSHTVSISGGTENIRALGSLGYFSQPGILKGTQFDRFTGNFNIGSKINKVISNETVIYLSQSLKKGAIDIGQGDKSGTVASGGSGAIFSAVKSSPFIGSGFTTLDEFLRTQIGDPGGTNGVDPEIELNDPKLNSGTFSLDLNTAFSFRIIDGLTLRLAGGINKAISDYKSFYPYSTSAGHFYNGKAGFSTYNSFNWLSENTLNYSKTIKEKHAIDATVGMSAQKFIVDGNNFGATRFNIQAYGYDYIDLASNPSKPTSYREENQLLSYFGILRYSLHSRYLFSAILRADGSSKFPMNRFGYFPAFSAAWKVHEEDFLKANETISTLKLRASYGQTGNETVPPYASLSKYQRAYTNSDNTGGLTIALAPKTYGVTDIRWESTIQTNFGLDIGLLKDRILLNADAYQKKSKDLLLANQISYVSGYRTAYENVGDIMVRGLELNLNTQNVQKNKFSWNSNFNISFLKGKVLSLNKGVTKFQINRDEEAYLIEVGKPLGNMYGYLIDGIYNTDEEFYNGPVNEAGLALGLGSRRYKDISGPDGVPDGIIDLNDKTIVGNGNPKFFGGFNNELKYGGLDLSFLFTFSYGNDIMNLYEYFYNMPWVWRGGPEYLYKYHLTSQNPQVNENAWNSSFGNEYNSVTSYTIQDGSYLRLKNIMLGYSLPVERWKKSGLSRLRFYVNAVNLLTFTKYRGFDPEVNYYNSFVTPGADYGSFPRSRFYTFGVNVTF